MVEVDVSVNLITEHIPRADKRLSQTRTDSFIGMLRGAPGELQLVFVPIEAADVEVAPTTLVHTAGDEVFLNLRRHLLHNKINIKQKESSLGDGGQPKIMSFPTESGVMLAGVANMGHEFAGKTVGKGSFKGGMGSIQRKAQHSFLVQVQLRWVERSR